MDTSSPSWFGSLALDPLTDRLARLPRPRNPMAPALPLCLSPAGWARAGLLAGLAAAACFAVRPSGLATAAGAAAYFGSVLLVRRADRRGLGIERVARIRDLCVVLALAGGQFVMAHRIGPLYFGLAVLLLDLLSAANARQMRDARAELRTRATVIVDRRALERADLEDEDRVYAAQVLEDCRAPAPRPVPVGRAEFGLIVFVAGPLAGLAGPGFAAIVALSVPAALLFVGTEAMAAIRLWRLTKDAAEVLAELERPRVFVPAARTEADAGLLLVGGGV